MIYLGKIQKSIINHMKAHGGVNVEIDVGPHQRTFRGHWHKDVVKSTQLLVDRGLINRVGENRYSFP